MEHQEDLELIYKTGTNPFFEMCLMAQSYSVDLGLIVGGSFDHFDVVGVVRQGILHWFFDRRLYGVAQQLFSSLFSKKEGMENIRHEEMIVSARLLESCRTPVGDLFDHQSSLNGKGEKLLREMFADYTRYAVFVDIPAFLFQVYLEEEFKKEVQEALPERDIENVLIVSHELTNYERFLIALQECAESGDVKAVRHTAQEFRWLVHDYVGDIVDEEYVWKRVAEHTARKDQLEKEIAAAKRRIEAVRAFLDSTPEPLRTKIGVVQELIFLYNERKKEVINQVNLFFRQIAERRIGSESIKDLRALFQLAPEEIIAFLRGAPTRSPEEASAASTYLIRKGVILLVTDGRYEHLLKKEESLVEAKGLAASPGKVRGKVSMVINHSHLAKFEEGHILVAPFTNVNYLPIMRKAKAILTETGGLTSHAAIVSRELKVPCIVGIRHLIDMLADGDIIEVDADKGVVKKVSQ